MSNPIAASRSSTPPPVVPSAATPALQSRFNLDREIVGAVPASEVDQTVTAPVLARPGVSHASPQPIALELPTLCADVLQVQALVAPSIEALREQAHVDDNPENGPLPARLGLCKVVVRERLGDDGHWVMFHTNPVCLERASRHLAHLLGPKPDLVMASSRADAETWRIFLKAAHDVDYEVPVQQMLPLSILLRELDPPEDFEAMRKLQDLCLRNVDDAAQRDELIDLFAVACVRGDSEVCDQVAQKISAKGTLQEEAATKLTLEQMQSLLSNDHLVCPEDQVAAMAHAWMEEHAPEGSASRAEAQRTLRACVRWAHMSEMGIRRSLARGEITHGEAGRLHFERTNEADAVLPSLFGESTAARAYIKGTSTAVVNKGHERGFHANVSIPDFGRRWAAMARGDVKAICSEPFTAFERRWRVVANDTMVGLQLLSGQEWAGHFSLSLQRPQGGGVKRKDNRVTFAPYEDDTTGKDTFAFPWKGFGLRSTAMGTGLNVAPWVFGDGTLRVRLGTKLTGANAPTPAPRGRTTVGRLFGAPNGRAATRQSAARAQL